jgi:hypothetical protein
MTVSVSACAKWREVLKTLPTVYKSAVFDLRTESGAINSKRAETLLRVCSAFGLQKIVTPETPQLRA